MFNDIEKNINIVYIHPFMSDECFKNHLKDVKGVVIACYGMGNFPINRIEMLNAIKEAVNEN